MINPAEIKRLFKEYYKREPQFFARAPGRINLIGEHIDYNNCPVLPAAVSREAVLAAAPRKDRKVLISSTQDGAENLEFSLEKNIPPFPTGSWGNYPKAAFQSMIAYAESRGTSSEKFPGLDILYHSTIPSAAGLSSSSALVVVTAILLQAAYTVPELKKIDFAALLAEGEKYVGTQGGGMDQTAILFGKANHAVKIGFNPLNVDYVPFPEEYTVVVADSMVKAPKTREALEKYNLRSRECRIAAAMLNRALSGRHSLKNPIAFLGDLTEKKTGIPQDRLDKETGDFFRPEPYTPEEITSFFGDVPGNLPLKPEPPQGFKLFQRFSHVMTEWKRVEDSAEALTRRDMKLFGRLMDQSHSSCRDLYEISCRELDVLTEICRSGGALGSRLTGAGFGGCTVSVVASEKTEEILRYIEKHYYREYLGREQDVSDSLFATGLTRGAECRRTE